LRLFKLHVTLLRGNDLAEAGSVRSHYSLTYRQTGHKTARLSCGKRTGLPTSCHHA